MIEKIKKISAYSDRVDLSCLDASEFLQNKVMELGSKTLINIDPPYYNKGKALYQNFFNHDDHVQLAKVIEEIEQPWMLTYDNTPEIFHLYQNYKPLPFSINYSAQVKCKGSELVIFSPQLSCTDSLGQLIT